MLACAAVAAGSAIAGFGAQAAEMGSWITTWAATPAPCWSDDLPAPFGVPEVLENQTVRQVARISVGGNSVRVVLSNCSTPDANNRWPDHVAKRLQEANRKVAVVNEAFSGNRVLTDGMGVNALARFDSDVLSHPNVSTVVVMMGINDIGWPGENAITPDDKEPTAEDIISGYKQLIDRAHAHGVRIVGATLTPFADTFKGLPTEGYYTPQKEEIRAAVNEWIRTGGGFDGVIDFDKVMEDPAKPGYLRDDYDCGDNLHPNDAGYKAMADAVDLDLLLGSAK
ncbi:MAG: SGNH/GDSL hydrolase family protein [Mesorhizobium sp.]|nr:MAG: SGNH/GDSL hydrolase family protein [Mesorhizobium sp.]